MLCPKFLPGVKMFINGYTNESKTVKETETHAAMERLAAESGLTSATSLAFCRAIF